ncbi:rod shape-determining protein MreC [Gallaecimonas pentaromativorans]|uniref:Cell shape-determining protein MreC n=1 Tax=Gallaecimonas pentaromativorans TaxID=584787 RepID=A0A3N1PVP3_9GAMM|nr:rod shape-determining protein MreC [Gallaecimonas pentaromativorans]ROQ30827.1 rod shape-determining protein MreC [Gallaecimonas pentaromativorans]
MKPIFSRGPSLQWRLLLLVVVSFVIIFLDHWQHRFDAARFYLNSLVTPVQYLADGPSRLLRWGSEELTSRSHLKEENAALKEQLLETSERLQHLAFLEQENNQLRSLLGSQPRTDARKLVAEVMTVDSDPFSLQIMINRGRSDGVYEGQPVLDAQGLIGQVVSVGPSSARVLLITDATHAVPVRVARNGIRAIAAGTGQLDELSLSHVPHRSDIKVGDLLLSSGLGGRFPEGYPVAKVTSVFSDEGKPFARVLAQPLAQLDRIRYLLLIWPGQAEPAPVAAPPSAPVADAAKPEGDQP